MTTKITVDKNMTVINPLTIGDPNGPHFTVNEPYTKKPNHDDVTYEVVERGLDISGMPKIGFVTALMIRQYYVDVYEAHKSEAFAYLHWSESAQEWMGAVPSGYKASGAHLTYYNNFRHVCTNCQIALPKGEWDTCPMCSSKDCVEPIKRLGSSHSHSNMPPFHSGTDDANEMNSSGFHITFGHLDTGLFGTENSFVAQHHTINDKNGQGKRFTFDSDESVFELPFSDHQKEVIRGWSERVALAASVKSSDWVVMIGSDIVFASQNKKLCEAFAERCEDTNTTVKLKGSTVNTSGPYTTTSYSWASDVDYTSKWLGGDDSGKKAANATASKNAVSGGSVNRHVETKVGGPKHTTDFIYRGDDNAENPYWLTITSNPSTGYSVDSVQFGEENHEWRCSLKDLPEEMYYEATRQLLVYVDFLIASVCGTDSAEYSDFSVMSRMLLNAVADGFGDAKNISSAAMAAVNDDIHDAVKNFKQCSEYHVVFLATVQMWANFSQYTNCSEITAGFCDICDLMSDAEDRLIEKGAELCVSEIDLNVNVPAHQLVGSDEANEASGLESEEVELIDMNPEFGFGHWMGLNNHD